MHRVEKAWRQLKPQKPWSQKQLDHIVIPPNFKLSDLMHHLDSALCFTPRHDRCPSDESVKAPCKVQLKVPTQDPPQKPKTESVVNLQPASESHDDTLQKLPAELRLQILSKLDPKSLGNLVLASRVYYEQFSTDRKTLIFKSFMNMLSGAALDAQMAYQSGTKDYLHARTKESVAEFLQSYFHYRFSTPWSSPHGMSSDGTAPDNLRPNDTFTMDEVLSMIRFHQSVVKPLAQHFADWALQNLAQSPRVLAFSQPLTETEETRIFRALYRYQICANLFGHRRGIDAMGFRRPNPDFDGIYILGSLESLFEPWEIEELTCITLFFETRGKEIFESVRRDLNEPASSIDADLSPDEDQIDQLSTSDFSDDYDDDDG
jgi:hypothetical protein